MLKNYLLVALRSILKSKIFSLINVAGLAIGIAAFSLIVHYVYFELNYEKFIPESERIYRVTLEQYQNNELQTATAENYPAVGPAMLADIPGVLQFARLYNMGYKNNVVISYEDAPGGPLEFRHRKFLYADSSFLPMFGYEMILGDPVSALAEPNSTVISETYAQMYFGEADPLGKFLHLNDDDNNDELCKVTGVFKDLPANTHLKFDILFSYETLYTRFEQAPQRYNESWQRKDMYTYIKLDEGISPEEVESKLPALINTYNPDLAENNREDIMELQSIGDIHLYSSLADEPEANGNGENVYALLLIAFFILVIAWVNYINLSTAKAMERANEVGVRKSLGALKGQLMRQFLMESALINFAALILATVLMVLALPLFNATSGLSLGFVALFQPWFVAAFVAIWLVGTLLSGVYPAFFLASFRPVSVLKGKLRSTSKGALLRKSLVVFQFVASVALIAGTIIVYNQLAYMKNQDIGMQIDQVLVVERPGVTPNNREAFQSSIDVFRDKIRESSNIEKMSASVTIPGKKREYKVNAKRYGQSDDQGVTLRINSMDYDFTEVFGMDIIAGRAFSPEYTSDQDTSIVITEYASKQLGFATPEEAIGQTIAIPNFRWNPIIVGVVNDYHQEALHKAKDPIIFYCTLYGGEYYSFKVKGNDIGNTISHIASSWEAAFPGNPFSYFFLDDYFNRQYENEQKFGDLFAAFSVLAILVGCLGLFGLSAFTAEQKTKEIGIRKALGSSVQGIFFLLSRDFLKLILVSILVAVPLTWIGMNEWLNGFAYRDAIALWVFPLAGTAVILAALLTVSFQTVKASKVNPIHSLRYE